MFQIKTDPYKPKTDYIFCMFWVHKLSWAQTQTFLLKFIFNSKFLPLINEDRQLSFGDY